MGFFDYLRMAMGWWSSNPADVFAEPLCFDLVIETPEFSLHDDAHQFDLHGKDC